MKTYKNYHKQFFVLNLLINNFYKRLTLWLLNFVKKLDIITTESLKIKSRFFNY